MTELISNYYATVCSYGQHLLKYHSVQSKPEYFWCYFYDPFLSVSLVQEQFFHEGVYYYCGSVILLAIWTHAQPSPLTKILSSVMSKHKNANCDL